MESQAEQTTQPELTETTQQIPTYVTYSDYTNNRLTCTQREEKMVPGTGPGTEKPPAVYYQVPLLYNYGHGENKSLNDFMLEGCELESSFGIQSKPGQSGRMEHTLMTKINMNDAEQARFVDSIGQIHAGCCYILGQMKGAVKMFDFNPQAPGGLFKNPIYRPRDEITGDYIPGRAPSIFFKLFSRGKAPYAEQTLFTGLDEKPIPWTLLQNVEMKFIPLIHIKRVYVGGGKASLQMEVVSAIVTSIRARGTATRQSTTIQRLRTDRPELTDTVAAQLAKITIDRQNQMMGTPDLQGPETQSTGDEVPTFAGVSPTGRQPAQPIQSGSQYTPTVASTSGAATLPGIPPLGGTQPTMQDFTTGAPPRPSPIPAVVLPGQTKAPTPPTLQFN